MDILVLYPFVICVFVQYISSGLSARSGRHLRQGADVNSLLIVFSILLSQGKLRKSATSKILMPGVHKEMS